MSRNIYNKLAKQQVTGNRVQIPEIIISQHLINIVNDKINRAERKLKLEETEIIPNGPKHASARTNAFIYKQWLDHMAKLCNLKNDRGETLLEWRQWLDLSKTWKSMSRHLPSDYP